MTTSAKPCRIAIIEPSPVIRKGLENILEEQAGWNIQDVYSDFQHFQKNPPAAVPELILFNPATTGFHKQFSARDLFADYPVSILVAIIYRYINPEILHEFDGVLDIYDDAHAIVRKLQEVLQTSRQRKKLQDEENSDLSDREKEILGSVALGLTNKEIADKHNISIHTVISHRKNITRKTGIKTVAGLTIYALFNNIISQNDLQ